MKVNVRRWTGVVLLLLLMFTCDGLAGRRGGSRRRGNRRNGTRRGNPTNQDLMQLLDQIQSRIDHGGDISFTPSPPTDEEVQCHVMVQRTDRIGGRCVLLGSHNRPACQSGPHLDPFNYECQLRRLNNTNSQQPMGPTRGPWGGPDWRGAG